MFSSWDCGCCRGSTAVLLATFKGAFNACIYTKGIRWASEISKVYGQFCIFESYFKELTRGSQEKYEAVLAKVQDVELESSNRLPDSLTLRLEAIAPQTILEIKSEIVNPASALVWASLLLKTMSV